MPLYKSQIKQSLHKSANKLSFAVPKFQVTSPDIFASQESKNIPITHTKRSQESSKGYDKSEIAQSKIDRVLNQEKSKNDVEIDFLDLDLSQTLGDSEVLDLYESEKSVKNKKMRTLSGSSAKSLTQTLLSSDSMYDNKKRSFSQSAQKSLNYDEILAKVKANNLGKKLSQPFLNCNANKLSQTLIDVDSLYDSKKQKIRSNSAENLVRNKEKSFGKNWSQTIENFKGEKLSQTLINNPSKKPKIRSNSIEDLPKNKENSIGKKLSQTSLKINKTKLSESISNNTNNIEKKLRQTRSNSINNFESNLSQSKTNKVNKLEKNLSQTKINKINKLERNLSQTNNETNFARKLSHTKTNKINNFESNLSQTKTKINNFESKLSETCSNINKKDKKLSQNEENLSQNINNKRQRNESKNAIINIDDSIVNTDDETVNSEAETTIIIEDSQLVIFNKSSKEHLEKSFDSQFSTPKAKVKKTKKVFTSKKSFGNETVSKVDRVINKETIKESDMEDSQSTQTSYSQLSPHSQRELLKKRWAEKPTKKNDPPEHFNLKQRLEWLQNERISCGTYVYCDFCDKLRYLKDVHDPLDLPDKWYCKDNTDVKYNKCSIPEESISPQDLIEMIDNKYNTGSVVWAKVAGYPWWPAIIDDDPDTEMFYWLELVSTEPTWYHVTFFEDNKVSRAWCLLKDLKKFDGTNPNKIPIPKQHEKNYLVSLKLAAEALTMSHKERVKKFTFLARYKGKIGDLLKKSNKPDEVQRKKKAVKRKNENSTGISKKEFKQTDINNNLN